MPILSDQAAIQNPPRILNRTRCPLCQSLNTKIVKSMRVGELLSQWRDGFEIDILSEYRGVSEVELWQCARCSISFFMPNSLVGSANLYAQLEKFDWYYMQRKWEYDVAITDLNGCRRVLEVGCGVGDFLRLGERAGLEIEGIEQNKKAIEEAAKQGMPVIEATVEDIATNSPALYDAVCSFQVLEHVPNPRAFLEACCRLLRPGGKLLFGVPNADSFIRHQFNVLDMPPHHMTRWPVKTMYKLRHFFPLKLKRVLKEPLAEYHVATYIDAYFSHFARGVCQPLNRPKIKNLFAKLLLRGLRRSLLGQTVYACYEKMESGNSA